MTDRNEVIDFIRGFSILSVILLHCKIHLPIDPSFLSIFSALTFQINWLESKVGYLPANWDILWSLSMEAVFYLFFPILCFMLHKQTRLILIPYGP